MRLALGTAQFGLAYGIGNKDGQVSRSSARAMVQLAAANDIDMLDTASAYGDSESCLGAVGVEEFKVVTKLSAVPDGCADVENWVQKQFEASLVRLRVGSIYCLMLHRPLQLLGGGGKALYQSIQMLKETGRVQNFGVSIYGPDELKLLHPSYRFDLVQTPFNLLDRRLQSSGWLRRLKDENVQIHTRSTFLQGLLLMDQSALPRQFLRWSEVWKKWHDWLVSANVSAVEACLAFPLSFPEIDRVVVGADNIRQLEQIIHAAVCAPPGQLPDLGCDAEELINPALWQDS